MAGRPRAGSTRGATTDFGVGFVSDAHAEATQNARARALDFVNTKLATMNTPPIDDFKGFNDGLKLAKFIESLSGNRVKVRTVFRLAHQ